MVDYCSEDSTERNSLNLNFEIDWINDAKVPSLLWPKDEVGEKGWIHAFSKCNLIERLIENWNSLDE